MSDAYDRLVGLLIGPLEVAEDLIRPDADLTALELDSLAVEEFMVLVIDAFGVDAEVVEAAAHLPLARVAEQLAAASGSRKYSYAE